MKTNSIILVAFVTGFIPCVVLEVSKGLVHVKHMDVTTQSGYAEEIVRLDQCYPITAEDDAADFGGFILSQLRKSEAYRYAMIQQQQLTKNSAQ